MCDTNCYADNTHADADCYGHRHSYSYCKTDAYCQTRCNTEGASYPAAAPERVICSML